ncbi:hypothetical protein P700755_003937 [Psychroflexus torquis ATCC 700755]|uniref:Uncharacterized protein n=1 Tax=Psychroflexus torquis (strain ATCC 700755 / CIP 106069 / ACAM 623) TaxID=313595 RepID=K4IJK6_PSYTT|nr:hypothetical protein P700755_003937 [Psychroflexus torquis ATCC 700755]
MKANAQSHTHLQFATANTTPIPKLREQKSMCYQRQNNRTKKRTKTQPDTIKHESTINRNNE